MKSFYALKAPYVLKIDMKLSLLNIIAVIKVIACFTCVKFY